MKIPVKRDDLIAGLSLIALGVFIILEAIQLDYVNEYGPGPGFLPLWLGIGLLALSVPLAVMSISRPSGEESGLWRETRRALLSWVGLTVAIALLNRLGFILSFTLLTVFLVLVMDRRSPFIALSVAVGSALGFYLIFALALRLPLPVGPWGF